MVIVWFVCCVFVVRFDLCWVVGSVFLGLVGFALFCLFYLLCWLFWFESSFCLLALLVGVCF